MERVVLLRFCPFVMLSLVLSSVNATEQRSIEVHRAVRLEEQSIGALKTEIDASFQFRLVSRASDAVSPEDSQSRCSTEIIKASDWFSMPIEVEAATGSDAALQIENIGRQFRDNGIPLALVVKPAPTMDVTGGDRVFPKAALSRLRLLIPG